MKKFDWKKLTDKLKALYNKYVILPLERRKKEKDYKKKLADIRKDFENRFGIDVNRVKDIMGKDELNIEDDYSKQSRLNHDLHVAREYIQTVHPYVARIPFLYEPEICDIHNENAPRYGKPLKTIIKDEKIKSQNYLTSQEKKIGLFEARKDPDSLTRHINNTFVGISSASSIQKVIDKAIAGKTTEETTEWEKKPELDINKYPHMKRFFENN